jgi:hypothetical protein
MNMMDWQSKQRALKEQERQRKLEATQSLRTHNAAMNEEEILKMRLQKDEERRKQLDAAQYLHDFRAKANMILPAGATKSPGAKETRTADVTSDSLVGYKLGYDALQDVHVSSIAERLQTASEHKSADSPMTSPRRTIGTKDVGDGIKSVALDESSSNNEFADENEIVRSTVDDANTLPETTVVDNASTMDAPQDGSLRGSFAATVSRFDKKETVPISPMRMTPDKPARKSITLDISSPPRKPKPHHADVVFSFGLITTSERPVLDGFLHSVQTLVQEILTSHNALTNTSANAPTASLDPSFPPFIKSVDDDGK